MTDRATLRKLHDELTAADDRWSAALTAQFGKDAGDRRYDHDLTRHNATCITTGHAFTQAREAFYDAGGFNALFNS